MTLSIDPAQGGVASGAEAPPLETPPIPGDEPTDRYAPANTPVPAAPSVALPAIARATPLPPILPLEMRDNSSFHVTPITRAHAPEIVDAYRHGARLGLLFPSKRRIIFLRPIGTDDQQNFKYDPSQIQALRQSHGNETPIWLTLIWQEDPAMPGAARLWVALKEAGNTEDYQADIELPFLTDADDRRILAESGLNLTDLLFLVARAPIFDDKKRILTRLAKVIRNGALKQITPEDCMKMLTAVSPEETQLFLENLRRLVQRQVLPCFLRRYQADPGSAAALASQLVEDLEKLGPEEASLVLNWDLTGKQIDTLLKDIPPESRPEAIAALEDLLKTGFLRKSGSAEEMVILLSRAPAKKMIHRIRVFRLLAALSVMPTGDEMSFALLPGPSWAGFLSGTLMEQAQRLEKSTELWKKRLLENRENAQILSYQIRKMAVLTGNETALPVLIGAALTSMRVYPSLKPTLEKFLLVLLQDDTEGIETAFKKGKKHHVTHSLYLVARGFLSGLEETHHGKKLLADLDTAYLKAIGSKAKTVSLAMRAALITSLDATRPDSILFIQDILAEAHPDLKILIALLRQSELRLMDVEAFFFSTESLAFVRGLAESGTPDRQTLLDQGMKLMSSAPPVQEVSETPAVLTAPVANPQAEAPPRLSGKAAEFARRDWRINLQEEVLLALEILSQVDPKGVGKLIAALQAKGTLFHTRRSANEASTFVRTGKDGFAEAVSLKRNGSLQDCLMTLAQAVPLSFFPVQGINLPDFNPGMAAKNLIYALIEIQIIRKALALNLAIAWAGKAKEVNLGELFSFPESLLRAHQEAGITGLMEWVRLNPTESSRIRRNALEEAFVLKWLRHRGETPPADQTTWADTVFDEEAKRNETMLNISPMNQAILNAVGSRLETLKPLADFLLSLEENPLSGTEEDPRFEEAITLWDRQLKKVDGVSTHLDRLIRSGVIRKEEKFIRSLPEWVQPEEAILFLAALKVLGELDQALLTEYLQKIKPGLSQEPHLAVAIQTIRKRIDMLTARITAPFPASHPWAKALKAALMEGLDPELGIAIAGDSEEESEARLGRIRTAWAKVQSTAPIPGASQVATTREVVVRAPAAPAQVSYQISRVVISPEAQAILAKGKLTPDQLGLLFNEIYPDKQPSLARSFAALLEWGLPKESAIRWVAQVPSRVRLLFSGLLSATVALGVHHDALADLQNSPPDQWKERLYSNLPIIVARIREKAREKDAVDPEKLRRAAIFVFDAKLIDKLVNTYYIMLGKEKHERDILTGIFCYLLRSYSGLVDNLITLLANLREHNRNIVCQTVLDFFTGIPENLSGHFLRTFESAYHQAEQRVLARIAEQPKPAPQARLDPHDIDDTPEPGYRPATDAEVLSGTDLLEIEDEERPGGGLATGPNGKKGPVYRTHPWGVFSPRTVLTPRLASLARL